MKLFAKTGASQPVTDNTTTPPQIKIWKSFRANSISEAVKFLNENKIEPDFIFPGNSTINIIYKQ